MDLGLPIRTIAPSLDSSVLTVLARTQSPLSLAQITRLADRGSRQGLALVLDRLVEHGLVTAQPAGHGSLYSLNRDHVLADAVLMALRARATIIERLTQALGAFDPPPIHASIFGSFARGDGSASSDIDVLLIASNATGLSEDWLREVRGLADHLYLWTGNRMEYIAYTEAEFEHIVARAEPIVDSWEADAITLIGMSMTDVLRRSGRP